MRLVKRAYNAAVDAVVHLIIALSSSKGLFAIIVLVTVWWILYNLLSPHPFDDWKSGLPRLVFGYTIIFGLWEGAQKIVQAIQIKHDQGVQQMMQQALDDIESLAIDIRRELDRAAERDEAAAERDSVLIGLCNQIIEDIERKKKGLSHD